MANGANADTAVFDFGSQAIAQGAHAEFSRRVAGAADRPGPLARHRADVDDDPVLAFEHLRQDGVDAIKRAVQVGVDQKVP